MEDENGELYTDWMSVEEIFSERLAKYSRNKGHQFFNLKDKGEQLVAAAYQMNHLFQ